MTKTLDCNIGLITIRNIMVEADFNELVEGIEVSGNWFETFEILGYVDLESKDESFFESIVKFNL
jgi:hypothetical protein